MNAIPTCREVERDLVAVAAGEAGVAEALGVERHVAVCYACRDELGRYRVLEGMVTDLRRAPMARSRPMAASRGASALLPRCEPWPRRCGIIPSPSPSRATA